RLGVPAMEAGVLSRQTSCSQIPGLLRQSIEFSRTELHVSPLPHREIAGGLDRFHARGFPICRESAPEHHARQAPERFRGVDLALSRRAQPFAQRRQAGPRLVSIAAVLALRFAAPQEFSRAITARKACRL